MRDPRILVTVGSLLLAACALAQEPIVAHTWADAKQLSSQHGVPVLIDFFTDW